jgi:hypothetical protein
MGAESRLGEALIQLFLEQPVIELVGRGEASRVDGAQPA